MHSFIPTFILSFIHSFIHSFIRSVVAGCIGSDNILDVLYLHNLLWLEPLEGASAVAPAKPCPTPRWLRWWHGPNEHAHSSRPWTHVLDSHRDSMVSLRVPCLAPARLPARQPEILPKNPNLRRCPHGDGEANLALRATFSMITQWKSPSSTIATVCPSVLSTWVGNARGAPPKKSSTTFWIIPALSLSCSRFLRTSYRPCRSRARS